MIFKMEIPGFRIIAELDSADKNDRKLLAKCFLKASREMKRKRNETS